MIISQINMFHVLSKRLLLLLLFLLGIYNLSATETPSDSTNFVTSSVLVISPTEDVYSVFGHVAIRMECPTHGLDYVFTFESDPGVSGFVTFVNGRADAAFVAVPTNQFLADTGNEGRGIMQYPLNLRPVQKQELWRLLDNDMVAGAQRKFNLLNNCVSMTIQKIKECAAGDHLIWDSSQKQETVNNGDWIRRFTTRSPWAQFLFITFVGTAYDDCYGHELRLCPEILVDELRRAKLVDIKSGDKRSVIVEQGKQLMEETRTHKAVIISPLLLFGMLLIVVCFITWAEWKWRWSCIARWCDIILLMMQTLLGILLIYIFFSSEIFGHRWNWYFIPFNPLPLIFWICLHKRNDFGSIYLLYTLVLVAFMAVTPLIPQLDLSHLLLTATMAVRCLSNYLKYKQQKNKDGKILF